MKPKSLLLLFVMPWFAGCGNGDDMTATDQKKMRDAMAPGKTDFGTMTPEQKAGFEKWKAGGGASAAPSAPGGVK